MTEEHKEGKDCCSSHGGGCCSGKKFICGVLFGLLVFGAGYFFGKCSSGYCAMKQQMCPISRQMMPSQEPMMKK